jgi:hypothetical protein
MSDLFAAAATRAASRQAQDRVAGKACLFGDYAKSFRSFDVHPQHEDAIGRNDKLGDTLALSGTE